jgi:putative membrane protein
MKSRHLLPLAATLSLALLGACSKPAPVVDEAAASAAATTTDAAANAAAGPTDPGGAVSPPQANGAVNTDANTTATDVAPASNSFTEGQARGHIENAGYANVTGLTKTPDGMWTAKATKDGKSMDVAVDFKGAVTPR